MKALYDGLKLLPLTPEIACDAYRIPDFHGDSADRIIATTARARPPKWEIETANGREWTRIFDEFYLSIASLC